MLSQQLRQVGCETPEGWAVLLALFPFFPPRSTQSRGCSIQITQLASQPYADRYEASEHHHNLPQAQQAILAFEDRIFLNRILGLSNLYYIDPEDQEILTRAARSTPPNEFN